MAQPVQLAKAHHRRRSYTPRRANPHRESNPGISSIVMGGFWIFVGQWVGGIIGGFLAPLVGGITGSLGPLGGIANGLLIAYAVGWVGHRFAGAHGDLMAAGAFAGSVGGALSGVLGSVGSIFGGGGGGGQLTQGPVAPAPTGGVGNQPMQPLPAPAPPAVPGLPAATTQQAPSNVTPIRAQQG